MAILPFPLGAVCVRGHGEVAGAPHTVPSGGPLPLPRPGRRRSKGEIVSTG